MHYSTFQFCKNKIKILCSVKNLSFLLDAGLDVSKILWWTVIQNCIHLGGLHIGGTAILHPINISIPKEAPVSSGVKNTESIIVASTIDEVRHQCLSNLQVKAFKCFSGA